MNKLLISALLSFSMLIGCGGGAPSDLAPYEIGLVGVYELDSFVMDGQEYNDSAQGWAGELWLQDDNTYQKIFTFPDLNIYENIEDEWAATLTTFTLSDELFIWDSATDIGVPIGGILTLTEGNGNIWNWRKVDTAPRN